ncbi:hypothetical protein [Aestuariivivens sp. NBU2969]|uniref:DUF7486 family protein n=1 Tax=Aestuariivivens sp. NBU2969 TaxID=2873267 RepID=UPI001CBE0929|nr:hypothetical protein [Aestuariivivens sp. NBU2969]
MKTFIFKLKPRKIAAFFGFFILLTSCKDDKTVVNLVQDSNSTESDNLTEVIWHIKAIHPDGKLLDVKAIGEDGTIYDVKAIQDENQRSILDIKAFVNGKRLPVKMLVSENMYMPVKAIDTDGTIIKIKSLTAEGEMLDVKGVSQSGNIINIKAINKEGKFYGVKAISPNGWVNDVKGVKMEKETVEGVVNGVDIYAHIKALTQSYY